ncbi:MAG: heme-copper oxidase subunit III [Actinomycetota bacterium]|nr:heme-copper oxidase subunit III [Actinomycetota bacterium]
MSVSEQTAPPEVVADRADHVPHDAAAPAHHTSTGLSNEKLGMWLFLGSECLLFGGLISAFLLYRSKDVEGMVGPAVGDLYDIPFTSVSSFVLLMSSLTMVLSLSAIQRADHRRARTWLLTTAMLGATFIAGQVYEFTSFVREGLGYTTNLQSSAFYTLTGFHGVHVTIGILMLVSLFVMSLRGRLPAERSETVEIVGLYWHFVDIIWIIIFTLVYLIPA